ncbi:MAG TPA: glycoside hydrolase family 38 C-terminal domain-containing protein [Armatimonadota bacterium]
MRKTLYVIGQAHLDPAWLWPWRDGCAEALTTMQSAVDRMAETPEFCFARSSAMTYRWAQEMDPRLFAEIRQRVAEGRWEVVNGWIEQPDCNLPSTESFVRHSLYGKGYFARELGVDVHVGYNVDSFGHAGGLPQILAGAGFKYYVFMRPHQPEMNLPPLFWWESPDGARVLAWRIPTGYGQNPSQSPDDFEKQFRDEAPQCFAPGFQNGLFFLGVGNHGGGPTKAQLARVLELQHDETLPEIRFGTIEQFFTAVQAEAAFADLPVVCAELQHNAPGCYAAMGEIKALNRRAERTLTHAEALSVLHGLRCGTTPSAETLREAWWETLFNQFHDILAGSCVAPDYQDARDSLGAACDTGVKSIVRDVQRLARQIDTTGAPEGVLCLANALPWERTALVQFDTFVSPHGDTPITHLASDTGETLPLQWLEAEACFGPFLQPWDKLTATVTLPAGGYRAFHLAHGEAPVIAPWTPWATAATDGWGLTSLQAADGTELLDRPLGLVVIDDPSDTWGHGAYAYRNELGRPEFLSAEVVSDGPVCRVTRQKGRWQSSDILLDIISYKDLDAVEVRVRVNWQQQAQMLKLELPTTLRAVRTLARAAGAVVVRTPSGVEEPCQDWVALEGRVAGAVYTVGMVNASTASYDCLDGQLRMTLLRAAPYAQHDPVKLPEGSVNPYLDQGWQERRFWIVRNAGAYAESNLDRQAASLLTPAEYVLDSAHPGTLPWSAETFSVTPDSVTVTALKAAEAGDGLILRLQEMSGVASEITVTVPPLGLTWTSTIAPWALQTLKIVAGAEAATVSVVDLLERPLA